MSAFARTFHDARPLPPALARDQALHVVARTIGRPVASLRDDHHLANDLKLDGQLRVELFMAIELACKVGFDEAEIAACPTVGALVALVEAKARPTP